jgi:TatD DNase family protein
MSKLVDTHCHLDLFEGIYKDPNKEDNLGIKTITVTNAPSFYTKNKELFDQNSNIRVALGLHPQLIGTHASEYGLFEQSISKTKYIGEIGLDGSPEFKSYYATQAKVFENILSCIKREPLKILTIHSRNAAMATIETISKILSLTEHRVILHWFSGSHHELRIAIKEGFYFSVNHKMAMSEKGKSLITKMPIDRILTETDAPFTFSHSINSRIKSLEATLDRIAKIKSMDKKECAELVYANFKAVVTEENNAK